MFKKRILGAVAVGTMIIAGCSASSTDFKAAAEKAITGATGLGAGSKATCDTPTSTKVGTTFKCTGTTADGTVLPLLATITGSKAVTVGNDPAAVTSTPPSDTTASSGSTAPAGSTAPTDTSAAASATTAAG